jgi:hypothetical protein
MQANAIARLAPLVAAFAAPPPAAPAAPAEAAAAAPADEALGLLAAVGFATRVTQNTDAAVAWAAAGAAVLQRLLLGEGRCEEALRGVVAELRQPTSERSYT